MTERRKLIIMPDLLKQERRAKDLAFWKGDKTAADFYADHAPILSDRPDLVLCCEKAGLCTCGDEEGK